MIDDSDCPLTQS